MGGRLTLVGTDLLTGVREAQNYFNGFFINIFVAALIVAATVLLY